MKVLFLSIVKFNSINERGIYTDLIRKFKSEGHDIYVVYPTERRFNEKTDLLLKDGIHILKMKTLNIQKANLIEKGIATLVLEYQFLFYIKKNFPNVKFDLVLYSTPPITFTTVVNFIKKRDGAKSYLLLKDIFPQNAVDLGFFKMKSVLHIFFRKKEKDLYNISDHIGCMSPANLEYLLSHNKYINPNKVSVNPNSIEPIYLNLNNDKISEVRLKFGIPKDSTIFIYGGNLGKPQGIKFLIEVLISNSYSKSFFVIVGDGTEFAILQKSIADFNLKNVLLLKSLSKNEYDLLLSACDVGLIFLDKSFTIPNYPSRLLSYMEAKIPILAATDKATDLGRIMEKNEYGLWSESGDVYAFNTNLNKLNCDIALRSFMGENGHNFLLKEYHVKGSYEKIINSIAGVQ
jgi:glycosyltransferase involved in cell wall biosynthesis